MIERPEWKSLTQIVGSEHVLTDPYDLDRYSGDALTPSRAFGAEGAFERLADLVVRPGSTSEVSQVLAWAQDTGTPVIPYGGGTGVMGGVLPVQGGVILDLRRLNRILEINPLDMTATVEAAVVLEDLEDALFPRGLMPDTTPTASPSPL